MEAVDYTQFAYHCLDHSPREEEQRLMCKANAVFCVSEGLIRKHRALNRNTYLLPNGVDLEMFNPDAASRFPRPPDLPTGGRLIGFIGSINCHIDIDLLSHVAGSHPGDHLILIGPMPGTENALPVAALKALHRLRCMRNVHVLGFRPIKRIPSYIASFDVCLIPYLKSSFNQERDPLKLYQYLAMGKPVVSTLVSLASKLSGCCYVANEPDEFAYYVSVALSECASETQYRRRIAFARAHSWRTLVAAACQRLDEITTNNYS
jgi:glycosyltransferase involved in cell wall biosynthesis